MTVPVTWFCGECHHEWLDAVVPDRCPECGAWDPAEMPRYARPGRISDEGLAALLTERLNDALRADPVAIDALVRLRVKCGPELAAHPTVQIDGNAQGGLLGVVGLLNGLCGSALPGGHPRIYARLQQADDGTTTVIGFEARTEPVPGAP